MGCLLTIFIIGDGNGDNITNAHHGTTPVVTQRCPKMHLELLFGLKDRVIIDMNCAVFDLGHRTAFESAAYLTKIYI